MSLPKEQIQNLESITDEDAEGRLKWLVIWHNVTKVVMCIGLSLLAVCIMYAMNWLDISAYDRAILQLASMPAVLFLVLPLAKYTDRFFFGQIDKLGKETLKKHGYDI